uniref:Uncharacterized protein n=1 Tax=Knipowitschia caucasica TaxID=637954 RepID=A0AAV2MFD2_KNICA
MGHFLWRVLPAQVSQALKIKETVWAGPVAVVMTGLRDPRQQPQNTEAALNPRPQFFSSQFSPFLTPPLTNDRRGTHSVCSRVRSVCATGGFPLRFTAVYRRKNPGPTVKKVQRLWVPAASGPEADNREDKLHKKLSVGETCASVLTSVICRRGEDQGGGGGAQVMLSPGTELLPRALKAPDLPWTLETCWD